jgi:hypothetical protein
MSEVLRRRGASRRSATASGPGVLLFRQGAPEGPERRDHILFAHGRLGPIRRAHQLRQRAPHQSLAHLRAAGQQRPVTLAFAEDFAHQRPHRAAIRPGRREVGRPVQEGEAEEAGVVQRPPGRLPPEVEEGPAEVRAGRPALPLELVARHRAQRVLGEVAHRQREALLAAVLAVQRAHRHVRGPRQFLRPHRVVAPLSQQHRHVPHEVGMALLPHPPHAPSSSSPPPERLTRGMNVPSATVCVAGGADMPRQRLPPEGGRHGRPGPRLLAFWRRGPVGIAGGPWPWP